MMRSMTLDWSMTPLTGLLHDTELWTVAWAWPLVYCRTKHLDCFMRLTSGLLHLKTARCMVLTSGLLHAIVAWQWHLNSCITRISVQLHDIDRWTIAWHWHMVCCMTLTFWLLRDIAGPSHDTDRWTVVWQWFLDYDTLASTLYWTTTELFHYAYCIRMLTPKITTFGRSLRK